MPPSLLNRRTLNLFVWPRVPDKIFLYYFQLHMVTTYKAKHWPIKYKWKYWDLLKCHGLTLLFLNPTVWM